MSLFACSRCKTIDNSATSGYWMGDRENPLCSACDQKIGRWHNKWPRQRYNPFFWKTDGRYVEKRWFCWSVIKWRVEIKWRKLKYWYEKKNI